ncbi:vacuolar sorting protein 9 domain-containing protein [Reticulomyxa filosa]|uniref:Vacuolar sorting protein 9 domain-containing protein n=1 Tax=Reticulomyxa filosa TaxID=46433 RepID=X6NL48_RETFI|nr:vacuolar sorting protein 9 domain-containing protein [Reticulomyxa filosa]|eukprot:ETO26643.1 vacuolar sorting protein 9 domain-containing protein [Reticulomyxa filosa]
MDTHFGIELSEGEGDHDGECDGIRYFSAPSMKGVLVPESQIIRITNPSDSSSSLLASSSSSSSSSQAIQNEKKSDEKDKEKDKNKDNGYEEEEEEDEDNIDSRLENVHLTGRIPRVVPGSVAQKLTHKKVVPSGLNNQAQTKISKMIGDEPLEDTIYRQVKADILSEVTTEGRSRRKFLQDFQKYFKNDNIISAVREFMNQLKNFARQRRKEKYLKNLMKCVNSDGSENDSKENKEELANKVDTLFNELLELAIEETVLQPKIDELTRICENQTGTETEKLQLKVMRLTKYPQSFFGIKTELESAENWGTAVYELSLVKGCVLPSEKIRAIVNTVKAVHISFEREQTEKAKQRKVIDEKKSEDIYITGDDILPIVIYVIIQASRQSLAIKPSDLMLIEGLVDPKLQIGESGYYLAVFHAAIQWIQDFVD